MTESSPHDWRQRFADTAELLPGIICELNLDFRITYVNQAAYEMAGYTNADFEKGVFIGQLLHPDDAQRGSENLQRILKGERIGAQEYRIVGTDGRVKTFLTQTAPIHVEGKVWGLRSCLVDITETKNAEINRRRSEERFQRVFDLSPVGLALIDHQGNLLEVNQAFKTMLGRGAGVGLSDLVNLSAEHQTQLATGASVMFDAFFESGNERPALETAWLITPLPGPEPGGIALLAQVEDVTLRRQIERSRLAEAQAEADRNKSLVEELRKQVRGDAVCEGMVSRVPAMRKVFEALPLLAKVTTTVLVSGESGTGKELIAKALHRLSDRQNGPFVALNTSALPDNLLESELFGYKAGAFTDAKKDKPGRFALAEGGTLFLDEIGDISPAMQIRLLRVLQERVYEPLGSTTPVRADVRVVAATNRDLNDMVQAGEFRRDLYYRLNVLSLTLPPLRERLADVPLLVEHFVRQFNLGFGKNIQGVTESAMDALLAHDFPGNIRELENALEHAFVYCKQELIDVGHLPEALIKTDPRPNLPSLSSYKNFADLEKAYILTVLAETPNRSEAAKRLGLHRSTLHRKLQSLGLEE
jgi:PAS domain S-box-containing protein